MSVMTLLWSLKFFKFYFKGFCFLYWTKKTQHFLHNENWQLMWLLVKCISVWDNLNSDCNSQTYKTYNCSLWVFGFWSFKSQFVRVAESPKWLGFQVFFFFTKCFSSSRSCCYSNTVHTPGRQTKTVWWSLFNRFWILERMGIKWFQISILLKPDSFKVKRSGTICLMLEN